MKEKAKQNLSYVEEVWGEESDVTKAKNTEIEKYNIDKLLGFIFSPGPYYYYLFNFQTMEIDYVSDSITSVLGYEVSEMTVANWMSWLHPEDSDFIPVKEQMVVDFLFKQITPEKIPKYKVSYDFRCKKKDGNYCRILHQAIAIDVDESGVMHKVLGVHTDITHLKKNSDQSVSFIGMDGEPSYYSLKPDKKILKKYSLNFDISDREIDVLKLAASGKNSKEIAENLNIAEDTVKTHRKNMLQKTNKNNILELVVECVKRGLI